MSAAAVERRHDRPLIAEADRIMERLPGCRVEIIGGQILASPLRDGPHGQVLTELMRSFFSADLHDVDSRVLQGIALWLPTEPEDYAIPDLSLVDADFEDHLIENNCYDPVCFRMVLEVTSRNYRTDLRTKVNAYAEAKVPVYVIVDRKHQRLHVLTEPAGSEYANHRVHAPGETVALPDSLGAKVTVDVDQIIRAGQN
ncbi:Uma2 family endonuclease [Streptomyces sp. CL12]|uniref:Uma2 family endonuclease n=1 Tax=Streptomyces sp. CL12 TaxID=3391744 RepID=UPI003A7F7A02